ncbi:MAG: Holliday junction resolvase RuvX [Hyphomicrobiales bacterium]
MAISDDLGMYAHPRPALIARGGDIVERVAQIVADEGISEVVVGLPLSMSGEESGQTRSARQFAARLRARLGIAVTEWDERLSSVEAGRSVRGRQRRASGDLDSAAAAVVLQAVLDARRGART